jgi:hypothetical protein
VRVVDTLTRQAQGIVVTPDGGGIGRVHASPDDRFVAFQHRGGIFVTEMAPGAPKGPDAWHRIDDPAAGGRPCGWSVDSRTLYLLLETDGFRCLWGQRIGDGGTPLGQIAPVRHFHKTMTQEFSNSFGNSITRDGFLYGGVDMRGNIWRLTPASTRTPSSDR